VETGNTRLFNIEQPLIVVAIANDDAPPVLRYLATIAGTWMFGDRATNEHFRSNSPLVGLASVSHKRDLERRCLLGLRRCGARSRSR
jgi:hypothetical protein